jgi:predicted nucleotidyltransferase
MDDILETLMTETPEERQARWDKETDIEKLKKEVNFWRKKFENLQETYRPLK